MVGGATMKGGARRGITKEHQRLSHYRCEGYFESVEWRVAIRHFIALTLERAARFADADDNRLQLIEYTVKIPWGKQRTLPVDHILHTLPLGTGTKSPRPEPEPWAGHTLGAQVPGEVQLQNAKEVLWNIVSLDEHCTVIIQRSRAGKLTPGLAHARADRHRSACFYLAKPLIQSRRQFPFFFT